MIHVLPPSVAQVEYALTMRAMAMLAPPIGAAEANGSRQLGPVDRVKPAVFGHDRPDDSMSQRERERKQKITISEERRVGNECVSTWRTRRSADYKNKKKYKKVR